MKFRRDRREAVFLLAMYLGPWGFDRVGSGNLASACLHYNRNNLSPRCQQALIALHEGR